MLAVEEPVVGGEDDEREQLAEALELPTMRLTASSTASSDSSRCWYASRIWATRPGRSRGRERMPTGLSETPASLSDGGAGSGSAAK